VATDRTIRSFNQKFLEMWRLPQSAITAVTDHNLLQWAAPQLEDPEEFLNTAAGLYASPNETSLDRLKLKDGPVFERYSQPHPVGSKIIGRVWSFRGGSQPHWVQERLLPAQQIEAVGPLAGGPA